MTKIFPQEKQLKKLRAKQKRLQAILGGEDSERLESELLAEDDEAEGEVFFFIYFSIFTDHQQSHIGLNVPVELILFFRGAA